MRLLVLTLLPLVGPLACAPAAERIPPQAPASAVVSPDGPPAPATRPLRRCASDIEPTRKLGERLNDPAGTAAPSEGAEEDSTIRRRLRDLRRRAAELKERAARAIAPVRLEVRLENKLPPTYVVEAVEAWLDGQPVFADTDPSRTKAPLVRAELAPGPHELRFHVVLRANFGGGIYDSVGYCFRASSGYDFALGRPRDASAPVTVAAILEQGSPTSTFSFRPGIRYVGSPLVARLEPELE